MKATGLMGALQLTAKRFRIGNVLYLKSTQFLGGAPTPRPKSLFIRPIDEAAHYLGYGGTLLLRQFA
jgi:hypothetical protein